MAALLSLSWERNLHRAQRHMYIRRRTPAKRWIRGTGLGTIIRILHMPGLHHKRPSGLSRPEAQKQCLLPLPHMREIAEQKDSSKLLHLKRLGWSKYSIHCMEKYKPCRSLSHIVRVGKTIAIKQRPQYIYLTAKSIFRFKTASKSNTISPTWHPVARPDGVYINS